MTTSRATSEFWITSQRQKSSGRRSFKQNQMDVMVNNKQSLSRNQNSEYPKNPKQTNRWNPLGWEEEEEGTGETHYGGHQKGKQEDVLRERNNTNTTVCVVSFMLTFVKAKQTDHCYLWLTELNADGRQEPAWWKRTRNLKNYDNTEQEPRLRWEQPRGCGSICFNSVKLVFAYIVEDQISLFCFRNCVLVM